VGNKLSVVWIWVALETKSRRIIGCVFGDRSEQTAQRLFNPLPPYYQQNSIFFTDAWSAYHMLPKDQHFVIDKATNHIERFNCTRRQRYSNLVRKNLSFSKSLTMHQRLRPTAFLASSTIIIPPYHSDIYLYPKSYKILQILVSL
jgi:IS1 family transposase